MTFKRSKPWNDKQASKSFDLSLYASDQSAKARIALAWEKVGEALSELTLPEQIMALAMIQNRAKDKREDCEQPVQQIRVDGAAHAKSLPQQNGRTTGEPVGA
jgi:ArsR family metal-binding transcriptional regulator